MKYDNLKHKTVFDFTTDAVTLKKMFPNYSGNNKEQIIDELNEDSTANGFYLWSLARYIGDDKFIHAVENQFDMTEIHGYDPD